MAARAKRSKRPSAASFGSKPPEPLVFFIDRSLGRKIVAQALREISETVEIHDDHFAPDAKDEAWLAEVGKRGWIVLTKDDRIRLLAGFQEVGKFRSCELTESWSRKKRPLQPLNFSST